MNFESIDEFAKYCKNNFTYQCEGSSNVNLKEGDIYKFLSQNHTGKCVMCGKKGIFRRKNTSYVEFFSNIDCFCDECYELDCEYWKERWSDYYSSLL